MDNCMFCVESHIKWYTQLSHNNYHSTHMKSQSLMSALRQPQVAVNLSLIFSNIIIYLVFRVIDEGCQIMEALHVTSYQYTELLYLRIMLFIFKLNSVLLKYLNMRSLHPERWLLLTIRSRSSENLRHIHSNDIQSTGGSFCYKLQHHFNKLNQNQGEKSN